jgi:hypothetical protein
MHDAMIDRNLCISTAMCVHGRKATNYLYNNYDNKKVIDDNPIYMNLCKNPL